MSTDLAVEATDLSQLEDWGWAHPRPTRKRYHDEDVSLLARLDLDLDGYPPTDLGRAACAGTGDAAFVESPGRESKAYRDAVSAMRRVCEACPLQQACLRYALDHNEQYGIWGGSTARERRRIREVRRQVAS